MTNQQLVALMAAILVDRSSEHFPGFPYPGRSDERRLEVAVSEAAHILALVRKVKLYQ